jgi:hypothetical protein
VLDISRIDGLDEAIATGKAGFVKRKKVEAQIILEAEQGRRDDGHFTPPEDLDVFDFTQNEKGLLDVFLKYANDDPVAQAVKARQEQIAVERTIHDAKRAIAREIAMPKLQALRDALKPERIAFLDSGFTEHRGLTNLRRDISRHLFGILQDSECSYFEYQKNFFSLNPFERELLTEQIKGDNVIILDAQQLHAEFNTNLSAGNYRNNGPSVFAQQIDAHIKALDIQAKKDVREAKVRMAQAQEKKETWKSPF